MKRIGVFLIALSLIITTCSNVDNENVNDGSESRSFDKFRTEIKNTVFEGEIVEKNHWSFVANSYTTHTLIKITTNDDGDYYIAMYSETSDFLHVGQTVRVEYQFTRLYKVYSDGSEEIYDYGERRDSVRTTVIQRNGNHRPTYHVNIIWFLTYQNEIKIISNSPKSS